MANTKKSDNKFLVKLQEFFKDKKSKYLLTAVLCVLVVIIFASSLKTTNNKKSTEENAVSQNAVSWQEYCEAQEHRLKYVLESVKGVDEARVFLMIDESPTITYLENTVQTNAANQNGAGSLQTTAVEIKNGTMTMPVVVVERLPKVQGVLIVVSGSVDIKLINTLSNVVSSVMNVSLSNVEVLEGNK